MYISRNKSIKVPFSLQTRYKRVNRKALLNSGATKNFIHPQAVRQLKLRKEKLARPRNIRNVDGTTNKGGRIEHTVTLNIDHHGKRDHHQFFVANIGPNDFILGYPFFEAANPNINWKTGQISDMTTILTEDAKQWKVVKVLWP
jgi:hypothetical protein